MTEADVEAVALRLCGYCKTWNSKPCGEQCALSQNDPTWEALAALPERDERVVWLIECPKHHQSEYYQLTAVPLPGTDGGTLANGRRALRHCWTKDVHAATKFPTKETAETEIAGEPDLVAVEHMFGLAMPERDERALIVAWLRGQADQWGDGYYWVYFANRIENGDHLKESERG